MKLIFKKSKSAIVSTLVLLSLLVFPSAFAQERPVTPITEMSLEELMQVDVTSVSKRPQSLQTTAAAVFVITAAQIKESTARNIPDILRTVPGVTVAEFDGNKWAVSVRGFNRVFANQLLVLVDGKTAYTQLFSGVYWDTVDVILEDIERIEVIRGPGAAVWGANAVNGVINIITKSSKDTLGSYIKLGGGSTENVAASLRYGDAIGDSSFARYWAKTSSFSDLNSDFDIPANDSSENYRGGFRIDSQLDQAQAFTFSLTGSKDNHHSTARVNSLEMPGANFVPTFDYGAGFTVEANYSNKVSQDETWEISTFFDRFLRRDLGLSYYANTADLEIQNTNSISKDWNLVTGIGARLISDEVFDSQIANLMVDERSQNSTLFNIFFQSDYKIIPDKLNLSLGSKLEQVSYTGLEVEPSVRLGYEIDDSNFAWSSISRAARVPSRADDSIRFLDYPVGPEPTSGLPYVIDNLPSRDLDSEITYAYEAGYRSALLKDLTLDLAVFINHYQGLIGTSPAQPYPFMSDIGPMLDVPVTNENAFHAESKGMETAISWAANHNLDFKIAYSLFDLSIQQDAGRPIGTNSNIEEAASPGETFSLLSQYSASDFLTLSAWIAHVAAAPSNGIDSYWRLDLKAKYALTKEIDFNLYGANLIEEHVENRLTYLLNNTEVPRSVFAEVEVRF